MSQQATSFTEFCITGTIIAGIYFLFLKLSIYKLRAGCRDCNRNRFAQRRRVKHNGKWLRWAYSGWMDAEKMHHLINKSRRPSFDIGWLHAGSRHVKELLSLCSFSVENELCVNSSCLWAEVNCKRSGKKETVWREVATERLMQAFQCSYRLMQPLSGATPAYLLKLKDSFLWKLPHPSTPKQLTIHAQKLLSFEVEMSIVTK